jgi:hypothetical protein
MASVRQDICVPRPKKDGGTFWVKIGTAWISDKGTQLVFDALPLPDKEGRCVANLFEVRDRSEAPRQPATADLDDDIPGF